MVVGVGVGVGVGSDSTSTRSSDEEKNEPFLRGGGRSPTGGTGGNSTCRAHYRIITNSLNGAPLRLDRCR